MNACDRDASRRLLDGALSPDEEAVMLRHLDDCEQCQAWLEQAAGEAEAWSTTRELLGCSSERLRWAPASSEFTSETQPHLPSAGGIHESGHAPLVDLSFLAPSDDPAFLGRIGPYEIVGMIGQGGMGVVLKAVDRSLSRYVAIKVLSPLLAGAGAARQRFAREARAMAALSHEHVVPIYAVDEHRGLPYFAMEYVPGGTLAARLSQEGPLEPVAAVRIAMQTALALGAAHDSGLVHRDIKPANILLDRGVERVRVTDFGLARVASEASDTASGMLAGTPQFMSPEQINRDACDARSDLFSLGSVLYAMCTGHAPFRGESVFAVLQRIVHEEPRSVREQNPNIPAWLEEFVARLMAKDCEARFQSAAEVAELLERELAHLQNPSVGAAPARPWVRRKPWFDVESLRGRLRIAALGVAAAIAALAVWQPWSSPAPRSDSSSWEAGASASVAPQAPSPSELTPSAHVALFHPTVPLWGADGLAEVQAYADALESSGGVGAPLPAMDPWLPAVETLRQRVTELSEEISPSGFPRSEQ